MSRALVYILSSDAAILARIKQDASIPFIFNTFCTARELDEACARRAPDLFLLDFDGDLPACQEYQPALGLASAVDLVPHEHVYGYLLKDASNEVLTDWLLRQSQLAQERKALLEQSAESFKAAMMAMSSMGEIGVAMRFLTDAFSVRTFDALCARVLHTCEEYSLSASIQLRVPGETYVASSDPSRKVDEAFNHMRNLGRLLEFKQRMIVNYEFVSILIHDMPEDETVRGRMRDNIAILAEGANERVRSLLLESDNADKQVGIRKALTEIQDAVSDIQERAASHQSELTRCVEAAMAETQDALVSAALSSLQENALLEPMLFLREQMIVENGKYQVVITKLKTVLSTLQAISGAPDL